MHIPHFRNQPTPLFRTQFQRRRRKRKKSEKEDKKEKKKRRGRWFEPFCFFERKSVHTVHTTVLQTREKEDCDIIGEHNAHEIDNILRPGKLARIKDEGGKEGETERVVEWGWGRQGGGGVVIKSFCTPHPTSQFLS